MMDFGGVDLAVLSACETGLGQSATGDSMLSLQRAFHVAGVSTTIASLWEVDDSATRALMVRFYANLWVKGMTKLDALREVQLWMLREAMRSGEMRGLKKLNEHPVDKSTGRLPPYYWAGFVLSGDWR